MKLAPPHPDRTAAYALLRFRLPTVENPAWAYGFGVAGGLLLVAKLRPQGVVLFTAYSDDRAGIEDIAVERLLRRLVVALVRLAEQLGHPVVLVFYPADWSPVCGDQMALYNEVLPEFRRYRASTLGISVDGVWCHLAFAKDRKLRFPLLADFEPKGGVARTYGVYRANEGVSERALFVIDSAGIIRWSHVSPIGINPGADGILAALEDLKPQEEAKHEQSLRGFARSASERA